MTNQRYSTHLLRDDAASDHRPIESIGELAKAPFAIGHASGKWSRTDTHAFDADVRFMRGGRRTAVTRTEATAGDFNSQINWRGDGWGHFHPARGVGHDCSVEWELDTWSLLDKQVIQLTDIRIRTQGGVLLEPCAATTVLLENPKMGELEVAVAHLDLDNTPLRRKANLEECHALRDHYRKDRRANPKRHHIVNFDGNRDQRDARWVDYFQANLFAGTGLVSGWHRPYPAQGTHGKSLLDISASDF